MFVKPKAGLKVRDPVTRAFLPAEGREVPDNDFFWLRRLRDGDVVRTEPPGVVVAPALPHAPASEAPAAPAAGHSA